MYGADRKRRRERFRCAVCGKRRLDTSVPPDGVCRWCKANDTKALRPNNVLRVANGISLTRATYDQLRRRADAAVTKVKPRKGMALWPLTLLIIIAFLIEVGLPSELIWIPVGAAAVLWPTASVLYIWERRRRRASVDNHVGILAQERAVRMEDRARFYGSPEWKETRRRVIERDGRACVACGKAITEDADLTIDHITPRSQSPELSLRLDNLHVLCRRCNSSKGARTFWTPIRRPRIHKGRA